MKYAVGMGLGSMIPSFLKIVLGVRKLLGGIHIHTRTPR
jgi:hypothetical protein